MAGGKYLQVCAVMRETELMSIIDFKRRISGELNRLRAHAHRPFDNGVCWGLGFAWRQLPHSEPFLITSSIVARGLYDCSRLGEPLGEVSELLADSMHGLGLWFEKWYVHINNTDTCLPVYSPGIREPIVNAAAHATATILLWLRAEGVSTSNVEEILLGFDGIRSQRIPRLGWIYAPGNYIVDLLHQCYILNAFSDVYGSNTVEEAVAEMIGQFATPEGFADALRIVPPGAVVGHPRDIPWLRPFGDGSIELLPKVARLWSLGELLVLICHLAETSERREGWTRLATKVADLIMTRLTNADTIEAKYPRHVMHALHGLSCYLSLLRMRSLEVRSNRSK
jgi:hypothetical protein